MKNLSLILTFIILIGFSCDAINEGFTDGYNEDPNNATSAPANVIFRSGSVAMNLFMNDQAARLAGMYSQHYTGSDRQYASLYVYTTSASGSNNMWTTAYVDALVSFRDAKSKIAESQTNVRAVIDISEALVISNVAALFGDVPYSEALNSDLTTTPKYDSQASVYSAALSLLNGAITDLTNGLDLPSGWDVHSYNGSADQWLKFAYSLKARLHMHLGQYSDALTAAANGILDASDDFEFVYDGLAGQNANLWYEFLIDRSGYITSSQSFATDLMVSRSADSTNNDSTRLGYFYKGAGNAALNDSDTGAFGPASNLAGFTAAETYLIMAEASFRAGNRANAIANLNSARQYWNKKLKTKLADYVDSDLPGNGLRDEIYTETYLSLNAHLEVFNFLRRIDWAIPGLKPTNGSSFPERFLYPQSELDANPNTPVQVAADLFKPVPIFE